MLIYEIASFLHFDFSSCCPQLLEVKNITPSSMSFLTSMRIATECKHNLPEAVIVFSPSQAMAAISAQKITSKKNSNRPYPIILYVGHDSDIPKAVTRQIAEGIDAVIYETTESRDKWQQVKNSNLFKKTYILPIPPTLSTLNSTTSPSNLTSPSDSTSTLTSPSDSSDSSSPSQLKLGYIGPIHNGLSLKKTIETLSRLDSDHRPKLTVIGTGRPRIVMPLVKLARANNVDVEWTGDEYDLIQILNSLDGFVQSTVALSSDEKIALKFGIPMIQIENLEKWFKKDEREKMSQKSKETYENFYNPARIQQLLARIIDEIK